MKYILVISDDELLTQPLHLSSFTCTACVFAKTIKVKTKLLFVEFAQFPDHKDSSTVN